MGGDRGCGGSVGVCGRGTQQSGRSRWQRQRAGGLVLPGLRHHSGSGSGWLSSSRGCALAVREDQAGTAARTGVARPGKSMKRTDSGSSCRRRCRRCDCSCPCRARHAPHWSGDAARAPQSSRQTPGLERRHPEPAGSWAAAAEEEEAAAAVAPWMR